MKASERVKIEQLTNCKIDNCTLGREIENEIILRARSMKETEVRFILFPEDDKIDNSVFAYSVQDASKIIGQFTDIKYLFDADTAQFYKIERR